MDNAATPLLKPSAIPAQGMRGYSVTLAKTATALVAILYFSGLIPSVSLLPQYFVHRLSRGEAHQNDNTTVVRGPCDPESNQSTHSAADDIQSRASDIVLYLNYASTGPALVACLFLGGYADVLGRRPLLLAALLAGLVKMLGIALTIRFDLPMWVLYATHAVDGIFGSWYIMLLTLFSAIADLNKGKRDRIFWISILATVTNLISAIFTVASGYIIIALGYFDAQMLLVGATAGAFLIALFMLPETFVAPEVKNYNAFSNVRRIMSYFVLEGSARRKATFWLCIGIFTFSVMNAICNGTIDTLYQTHRPFCWDSFWIGLYGALRMGGQYVFGVIFLKALQPCFKDEYIAIAGLLFQAASFVLEAFIKYSWQFSLVPVIGTLGATTVPIVRGIISSLVSSDDQGAIFSSVAVMEAICNVLAMTGVLRIYSATVSLFAGASYLLMAAFSLTAIVLFLIFLRVHEKPSQNYEQIVEPVNTETEERPCLHKLNDE